MLRIKHITLRNFLSTGNCTLGVRLDEHPLTLIIGENLDVGGRNGVGKSSLLQAISFALYGKPLTQIKKDNLVNAINLKHMMVTIEFERDGRSYRIERGRKPAVLRWFVNDQAVEGDEEVDEAQGENSKTQEEINRVIGMSHSLFRQIVLMSTFVEPFLKLKLSDQRSIIEELLGVTLISTKAEALKELIKGTKDAFKQEQFRLEAIKKSNEKISAAIADVELKSRQWTMQHDRLIATSEAKLAELLQIDVDAEIEAHKELVAFKANCKELEGIKRQARIELYAIDGEIRRLTKAATDADHMLNHYNEQTCPTCKQTIQTDVSATVEELEAELAKLATEIEAATANREAKVTEMAALDEQLGECENPPVTFYDDVGKAYEHRNTIAMLQEKIAREKIAANPYQDQIDTLRAEGIQPLDYSYLNDIEVLERHQTFVLKLLTSKDSFIRKKIIEQNLSYLNHRLNHYLDKMSFAHEVVFKSDLSVDIALLGRDYDFDQLSRGEQTRVNVSMSLAMRDVWESLNHAINVLGCDEILDQGIDTLATEQAFQILKSFGRDRHKNVILISHREELAGRADHILTVRKENNFTTYIDGDETVAA